MAGDLPDSVEGCSRIFRDDKVFWEKPFFTGEEHMSHSIRNLEYHHFKNIQFLRPGDIHIHLFGTAVFSYGENVKTQPGDVFEIESDVFGDCPLRNSLRRGDPISVDIKVLLILS